MFQDVLGREQKRMRVFGAGRRGVERGQKGLPLPGFEGLVRDVGGACVA